jgi:hypothetical protein
MAFKATSHVKRDELEGMGIRVKAHKTAERCIRSLDKRAKKLSSNSEELPPVSTLKTLALITSENHELVPYLFERPFLVQGMILLLTPEGPDVADRFTGAGNGRTEFTPTKSWEESIAVIKRYIEADPGPIEANASNAPSDDDREEGDADDK